MGTPFGDEPRALSNMRANKPDSNLRATIWEAPTRQPPMCAIPGTPTTLGGEIPDPDAPVPPTTEGLLTVGEGYPEVQVPAPCFRNQRELGGIV